MAVTTSVRSIRSSISEWESWLERAHLEGMTVNAWIRRALNDTVQLERLIEKTAEKETRKQEAWSG